MDMDTTYVKEFIQCVKAEVKITPIEPGSVEEREALEALFGGFPEEEG